MVDAFKELTEDERELMYKAPVLVCILIAGADGKIDRKEIQQSITTISQNKERRLALSDFFADISNDFEDKIKILIQNYPYESTQRNPLIVEELTRVNQIWSKLDQKFADYYYNMLLELAQKVASSSGGWLGIRSIGSEEAQFVNLPMIRKPSKN